MRDTVGQETSAFEYFKRFKLSKREPKSIAYVRTLSSVINSTFVLRSYYFTPS